jgi:hypothetical protein
MAHALDLDVPQTVTRQQRFVELDKLPSVYRLSLRVVNFCHYCRDESLFYSVNKTRQGVMLEVTVRTGVVVSSTTFTQLGKGTKFCSICGWCLSNRAGRKSKLAAIREQVYLQDYYECVYCARKPKPEELSLDHVIPISKGGTDAASNLVTACRACNELKSNRAAPPMVGGRYRTKRWILRRASCSNFGIENLGRLSRYTRNHLTLDGERTLCKRKIPRGIDWACVNDNCKNCEKALVNLFGAGQLPLFDTSQVAGKWREFLKSLK